MLVLQVLEEVEVVMMETMLAIQDIQANLLLEHYQ
jgi:hypothetical protein